MSTYPQVPLGVSGLAREGESSRLDVANISCWKPSTASRTGIPISQNVLPQSPVHGSLVIDKPIKKRMSFHHSAPASSVPFVLAALLFSCLACIIRVAEAFTLPRGPPPAPTLVSDRRRTAAGIDRTNRTQWKRSCSSSQSPSTSTSPSMASQTSAGEVGPSASRIGGGSGGSRMVQSRTVKATSSAGASVASSCESETTNVVRNRAGGDGKGSHAREKKLQGDLKRETTIDAIYPPAAAALSILDQLSLAVGASRNRNIQRVHSALRFTNIIIA